MKEITIGMLIENYFQDLHAENYHGLDDNMVDDYEMFITNVIDENPLLEKFLA
jgi:hypothetical protein